ncbi:MAG: NUDIX hydrolase [Candidatus Shapirobacteria bacterium]|jgi:ADP-ribose pyrophosphatase
MIKKWQELSRELVFEKYGRKVEKVIFKIQNGKESDFYIKNEGNVVCVLALTSDKKVVLAKQYRPGPKKILTEMPGGAIDKNEKPEESIKRELLEETGYTGDFKFVTKVFNDAYSTKEKYCFVATNCQKIQEIKNEGCEFTEVILVSVENFKEILRKGQITDVEVGFLGLDYLELI